MELKALAVYRAPEFDLFEGMSTLEISLELSDERKEQMLADHPEMFEQLSAAEETALREKIAADEAQAAAAVVLAAEIAEKTAELEATRVAAERSKLEIETRVELLALEGKEDLLVVESPEPGAEKPQGKKAKK